MTWRLVVRLVASALATVYLGLMLWLPQSASAAEPVGFQASTSAIGVRATVTIPNGPLASQIVDSGGPTAQASLDVGGNGTGFAAFPDAGPFIGDLPGLVKGLLKVPLPIPDYPFRVSADSTRPEVSVGAGVYLLEAQQREKRTSAKASTGLGVGVNAALIESTADVSVNSDGSVVSTAVSDVQGLTLGPLTLGQIKSKVVSTLSPEGKVSTETDSEITGVRIGTIPISINPDAIDIAGTAVPLPLGSVVNALLKPLGITLTVLPSSTTGNTVTTGALQISGPLETGKLGTSKGDFAIVVGQASATVIPAAPITPDDDGPAGGPPGPVDAAPGGAAPDLPGAPSDVAGAPADLPDAAPVEPAAAGGPPPTAAGGLPDIADPVQISLAAQLAGLRDAFGISNLYLVVAFTAAAAFLTESFVRLIGVRGPWTSTRG